MKDIFDLKGRVALVTGCSGGLGVQMADTPAYKKAPLEKKNRHLFASVDFFLYLCAANDANKMKQYKAIFLDWDDTIGDWTTAEHKALQDIYATYRLDRLYPTFEDYLNAYKPYNLELWGMYGRGEVTKEWLHLQRFLRPLQVNGANDEDDAMVNLAHAMGAEFLRLTNKYFCLMPDAEKVVKYLVAKYPLTIISNGFKEVQYYKFEHSGLAPYFTHTLISEEVGINKPQPGIFEIALQRNGITAEEAVMVGDSYASDIAGAKAAGIDQVWIRNERLEIKEGETATFIVPNITDIIHIL